MRLTLIVAAISVPLNVIFGLAAACDRQVRISRQGVPNHLD
jgi:ABC-type sulfate transport system permease subunit